MLHHCLLAVYKTEFYKHHSRETNLSSVIRKQNFFLIKSYFQEIVSNARPNSQPAEEFHFVKIHMRKKNIQVVFLETDVCIHQLESAFVGFFLVLIDHNLKLSKIIDLT